MKKLTRSIAAAMASLAAGACFAQAAPTTTPVFTHDKAVEAATYLARQKAFAGECPFSDVAKASLDRLETFTLPALGLTPEELGSIGKEARTAALELIKEPTVKKITCPIIEAALRRQTEPTPQKLMAPPKK